VAGGGTDESSARGRMGADWAPSTRSWRGGRAKQKKRDNTSASNPGKKMYRREKLVLLFEWKAVWDDNASIRGERLCFVAKRTRKRDNLLQ